MKSVLILFVSLCAFATQGQQLVPSPPTVHVSGEGIVKVVPDQVLIKSRIEHEGDDPQEVKKQNDAVVNQVIKYLKSEGIDEKNIKTDYLNLNKNYNYNDKTYSYVANQAISIKLESLKNYEKIMSGLLESGLNRIDGIQFMSSEKEAHTALARKKAVEHAKTKAEQYAGALGQKIGHAVKISELETENYPPVYRMEMMKSSADSSGQETMAPGEMEVSTKVTVSFLLID